MVTLLQRVKRDGTNNIEGHLFFSVIVARAEDDFTANDAHTALGLLGGSQDRIDQRADFDLFKTHYDTLSSTNKRLWLIQVNAYTTLLDRGHMTKADYDTNLGSLGLDTA